MEDGTLVEGSNQYFYYRNLYSEQYEVSHEDCVKEAFGKFNVVGVRIITLVTKLGNEKEFHPNGKPVEIKDNDDIFYVHYPDKQKFLKTIFLNSLQN